MEISESNLQVMGEYLQQTLSPDLNIRKKAENFLVSVEANKSYPLLLLHLMSQETVPIHIRVSGAITFKNFIKRNWRVMDGCVDKIHPDDRRDIKQHIVELMLKSPKQIQMQLSDAISIIGREDFPDKWPNLITEMVNKFDKPDFHVLEGVLQTAHSIFKRYRHEFKSERLWTEIKFVLDNFAAPFTKLFQDVMTLRANYANDQESLKVIFSSLLLICKIFHSLNFQDLPEHFEDNMDPWMEGFLELLTEDNKLLQTGDFDEAGLLEQVKSQVCDCVALYAQKYGEEFSKFLPQFVTAIWHLLISTGQQVKYDLLVSNAIKFLASVAERPSYKSLFEDSSTLSSICEKVIVPNIQLREADEELFEDNAEEYIRRDIEGSDVDTRRRSACDLVQALSKIFEGPVIENFSKYVQGLLAEYAQDPAGCWKSKDSAVYLVTTLASRGSTQKAGVTKTSELVNIVDFCNGHILPELQRPDVNTQSILRADSLKYLMVFRSQLPKETLMMSLPLVMDHMTTKSVVVNTYSAHCIERFFMVRTGDGKAMFTAEDIKPMAQDLLIRLFQAMEIPGSLENEYIMKAIMRTMSLLHEDIVPIIPQLLERLTQKLLLVSKNPGKAHFNHYLFECLCVAIRSTCKMEAQNVTLFEHALFKPFTDILRDDVQEFIPYVFQILSLLIELHPQSVPNTYMEMFPLLLLPLLWDRPGNIPPLVRLLQAFVLRGACQIPTEKVNGMLGVFQKLLASKTHDHEGFYLLNAMVEHMPSEVMQPNFNQIFFLLFQRLSSSKTTKFVKSLLVFFSLFAIKYGPTVLVQIVDGIQSKMFGMVLERLYIPELQKVTGQTEKKLCAVGVTKILTECPALLQQYEEYWAQLLQALVGLFELPEDDSIPDDEHFIEIEETPGYQAAYSQLAFAGKKEHDPLAGQVDNPKLCLAKGLEKLATGTPGKLQLLINSGVQPQAQTFLHQYLQSAQVTLV